jgi:DNA-directed RNA polymerase subunit RPC12/RpoP
MGKPLPADVAGRLAEEELADEMEVMDIEEAVTAALHRSEDEDEEFVEGRGEEEEGSDKEASDEGEGERGDEEDEEEDAERGQRGEDDDDDSVQDGDQGEDEEGEEEERPSELIIINEPRTNRVERPASIYGGLITNSPTAPSPPAGSPMTDVSIRYPRPESPRGPKIKYRCANTRPLFDDIRLDRNGKEIVSRPVDETGKYVACGLVQERRRGESLKCLGCGGMVMEKVRTTKLVQFQAI